MKFLDRTRGTVRVGAVLTLGVALLGWGATAQAAGLPGPSGAHPYKTVCAGTAAGHAHCDALTRTDVRPVLESALGTTPAATVGGYGPSNLQSAYNLAAAAAAKGAGETVAVVDAYNDPNANSDLSVYRAQFGLPACTVANGCFKVVSQTGSTTALPPNAPSSDDWTGEESLDVDMVSAICPNCHIDLVEANSTSYTDLGTAMNQAVTQGAKFVSNSYGGSESSAETSYDSAYYDHPGVAVTVSSGDGGYGVEYPAASPYVTSVGGTSLSAASNARGWTESAWSTASYEGAGSGCSAYEAKPAWQTDTGCGRRTVADVSADADPATGVAVYDSFNGEGGWNVYGGTSVASPIIASVYALAGNPAAGTNPASYPYAHTANLYDVTSGATASCSPAYLCTAGPGYDGPTGLGTPNGTTAFAQSTGTGGSANAVQAFQGANGHLWTATSTGGTDLGAVMMSGTSPSITALAAGGNEIAYQGGNGDLWVTSLTGTPVDSHLGMMSGTSPAIAAAASGGFNVAFQANTGMLWDYTSSDGRGTSLGQAMVTTSSPSISAPTGAAGGYEIAYQGSNVDLWVTTISGTPIDSHLGMAGGTSPAIAAAASGGFNVAFQANTGSLWDYTSSDGRGTGLNLPMLTGTSPAITAQASAADGYEIAYLASGSGYVSTTSAAGTGTTTLSAAGAARTTPSVTTVSGTVGDVAFHAPTGDVWNYSPSTGAPFDLGYPMLAGTSPSIAP
ncbi:hypothetical protein POF50_016145 [Streptomyces sp. SL13]|uniref:Peptidase S53 domain-containing protein n=1 Tax=Streptantibioticus silvisoli TaxID=2705255 RepID=A0AA90H4V9_9ACTN|nr:hypothetical protein [Streptantibioticus silvisoli]MDI5970855.1 hypothetical protein [Streptantibioticus silvisoli]